MYWVRHLTLFFSWMVTHNSCLIWQIISFILPPNEYGCVYTWTMLGNIIFWDEVHFDVDRYVNKQNCRIWGTENPHAYIEKPTHPKLVTVWCGFWSRGIIGPFFFAEAAIWTKLFSIINRKDWIKKKTLFLFQCVSQSSKHFWNALYAIAYSYCFDFSFISSIVAKRFPFIGVFSFGKRKKGPCTLNTVVEAWLRFFLIKNSSTSKLKNWTHPVGYCMTSLGSHLNEIIFHY